MTTSESEVDSEAEDADTENVHQNFENAAITAIDKKHQGLQELFYTSHELRTDVIQNIGRFMGYYIFAKL